MEVEQLQLQLQLRRRSQLLLPRFMPRQLGLVLLSMDLNLARDPVAWDRTDPERRLLLRKGHTGRMRVVLVVQLRTLTQDLLPPPPTRRVR